MAQHRSPWLIAGDGLLCAALVFFLAKAVVVWRQGQRPACRDITGFTVPDIEAGGLSYWINPAQPLLPPVVLLHGSGQDEQALRDFAEQACPEHPLVAVRGRVPWEGGFAFFRRKPDRSLDYADLAEGAHALLGLLRRLVDEGHPRPVLLGYSNGAVAAAAWFALDSTLSAGAVLLRPLTPSPGRSFRSLAGYPVLLVAAQDDARRAPGDAEALHEQLLAAGAASNLVVLPTAHPLTERDAATVASWLGNLVHRDQT